MMLAPPAHPPSPWSTSSFGAAPDTSPLELLALGEHVALCSAAGARAVALGCALQKLKCIVLARRVSALAVLATLIGATWLVV